jgi:hypothetical protein
MEVEELVTGVEKSQMVRTSVRHSRGDSGWKMCRNTTFINVNDKRDKDRNKTYRSITGGEGTLEDVLTEAY